MKHELAKTYNSRRAAYEILETVKRKSENLCERTNTQTAVIHYVPKSECSRKSSASFGTKHSILEALFEENALGAGLNISIKKRMLPSQNFQSITKFIAPLLE